MSSRMQNNAIISGMNTPDFDALTPAQTALAEQLLDALPQTQCTKCGYQGCRPYARAMATDTALHNQCPPGGAQGIVRLATILKRPAIPLNPDNGQEKARALAIIDDARCIGCTLCIQACPVDAIMGAPKQMHFIIPELCTGCDLCVAPCPVDCIEMQPVTSRTGWAAWSQPQADAARARYEQHQARQQRDKADNDARLAAKAAQKLADLNQQAPLSEAESRKKAIIEAAIERARQKKAELAAQGVTPKNIDSDQASQ